MIKTYSVAGRRLAALSAILLPLGTACATPALAGQFVVVDEKAPQEISEVSRLYVDGELAATFILDSDTTRKAETIQTVAGRVEHTYALCGEIVIRTPEGKTETHNVSSAGVLHNPDGHVFQALGSANFTDFYLIDPNDPDVARHHPGHGEACVVATS
ncbi:hypothetical protein GOB85_10965 [Acetobacter sp. LMG 1636]|uniref:Uncharacterized protein n=2 Tax=Acetobacter fallax TaxID=1737473 RepID=A0ABX0KB49_9PROT|nr:hypothetical protein [Acetobacter fallax]NHO36624.1 hypothetical protein [Acetobacter fallax]